jgi:hypothetical protein
MHFVLTKRAPYVLFCLTPSERAAVGVTEQQTVQLLARRGPDVDWTLLAEWSGAELSHTDFMVAWHRAAEPEDPVRLLDVLPAPLRDSARR